MNDPREFVAAFAAAAGLFLAIAAVGIVSMPIVILAGTAVAVGLLDRRATRSRPV